MLAPEVRNRRDPEADGHFEKADLVMFDTKLVNYLNGQLQDIKIEHPLLVFEGKGGTAANHWWEIRNQLCMWCNGYKGDAVHAGAPFLFHDGRRCWAIGAKGSQVAFWLFKSNGMHPVTVVDGATRITEALPQIPNQDPPPVDNVYYYDSMETLVILVSG